MYDAGSNRMIVFGGTTENFRLNDAWVLTNANGTEPTTPTWLQLSPTGPAPTTRAGPSGVYDPTSNRLIIFGGEGPFGAPPPNVFGDTWVLTNADGTGGSPAWVELSPSGPLPPARTAHSAIYDPGTNRMILFAGFMAGSVLANDVWVLTQANGIGGTPSWVELNPSGDRPQERAVSNVGYSSETNRLIIFRWVQSGMPTAGFHRCLGAQRRQRIGWLAHLG